MNDDDQSVRHEQVAQELRDYAEAMAGTGVDLDEDLEAAGVECLLENTDA